MSIYHDVLSSSSRSLYRIARFPLVSLLSITSLIFLLYGSLKGKRRKSIFRAAIAYCCVRHDEIRDRRGGAIASKHATRRTVFRRDGRVIPVRALRATTSLTVFATAIVSKHRTHASELRACARAHVVPPAFVVKAC